MHNSKNIILVLGVFLFLLCIIMLTVFFIKLYIAKKTNNLLKISKIETDPFISLKWYQLAFLLIVTLIVVSNKVSDQTKNYVISILLLFFIYILVRVLIKVIKVK
ncbi:MAG: hypothetical protein CVV49_19115 [Spirochaetae bacterium HGW-Spirochaetae-5]|nr:MAG: hypothetical protein CVV49_19115 [Spirochaetae bacterium HGW-Spirochaetae-5]